MRYFQDTMDVFKNACLTAGYSLTNKRSPMNKWAVIRNGVNITNERISAKRWLMQPGLYLFQFLSGLFIPEFLTNYMCGHVDCYWKLRDWKLLTDHTGPHGVNNAIMVQFKWISGVGGLYTYKVNCWHGWIIIFCQPCRT